jgi:hypothetical protein
VILEVLRIEFPSIRQRKIVARLFTLNFISEVIRVKAVRNTKKKKNGRKLTLRNKNGTLLLQKENRKAVSLVDSYEVITSPNAPH